MEKASEKTIAKARPRQKPAVTLTSVCIPVRERKRIDIETQRSPNQKCYEVSKAITRLLRHDQTVLRGIDGAIQYNDIRRSSIVLRSGHLKIGYLFWQREEDLRKDFNIA